MDNHFVGFVCEQIVIEHFLRLGYWVYTPVGRQGPIDIIAVSPDGEVLLIDAKAQSYRKDSSRTKVSRGLTPIQKMLGVRIAYVNADTREVMFKEATR